MLGKDYDIGYCSNCNRLAYIVAVREDDCVYWKCANCLMIIDTDDDENDMWRGDNNE